MFCIMVEIKTITSEHKQLYTCRKSLYDHFGSVSLYDLNGFYNLIFCVIFDSIFACLETYPEVNFELDMKEELPSPLFIGL